MNLFGRWRRGPSRTETRAREAEALVDEGNAHRAAGRAEDAERSYRRALKTQPLPAAHLLIGALAQDGGRLEEAAEHYHDAVEIDPAFSLAWYRLGELRFLEGQYLEAAEYLERAVELDPAQPHWQLALGVARARSNQLLGAKQAFEAALRLAPDSAAACEELAGCLLNMGHPDAAVPLFRRAQELNPAAQTPCSNMLFALNFISDLEPHAIYEEHVAWARRRADGLVMHGHANERNPERRLRVGYVSPDLKDHPLAFYIEPVLAAHDRSGFEVTCYADVEAEDTVSARLKNLAGRWLRSTTLGDDALAERIREDGIDILVDLAGHTAGGKRMLLFAHKPAPVQVTWLGYINTTGLQAIDYRIADWHACPAGFERYHSEKLVRLPDYLACFAPSASASAVGPLPARQAGHITFGSLNNTPKVTPRVIAVWSRVLLKLASSRLLMLARGGEETRSRIAAEFARHGVDPGRIEFLSYLPLPDYLALHERIDINLDTFPYTGGTTSCHSLWMGVPVVTLAGRTVYSKLGKSLLRSVGLEDLAAESEDGYVEIAVALAGDLDRLERLRLGLRARVAQSPLTDNAGFTTNLEAAYRAMWRTWCTQTAL